MTYLPVDQDGQAIPAMRLRPNKSHSVTVSSISARNLVGFDTETRVISVFATVPVYLAFSEANTITAESGDHFFPANIYYDISIGGGKTGQFKFLAAIAADPLDTGTVFISEKN